MIRFESDYLEGAHPLVLDALVRSNAEQTPGYGLDPFCDEARALIRQLCGTEKADVHFLVGGTQVNRTVIAAALRPHQGVVAAECGHINVHESGAIENSGHKVLTVPAHDGKVDAADVRALCERHFADGSREHGVQPGMVYVSNPTEEGTVYSRAELAAIAEVCRKYALPLYLDGARLGSGLTCSECDYDLPFLAEVCDAFTIGGTKNGALFGEALIIRSDCLPLAQDFRYILKQNGGMLAKGRLLGVQFTALLKDGLYWEIGRKENELALRIRDALLAKGYRFMNGSVTNQQFPILPDTLIASLADRYSFSYTSAAGNGQSVVRICTSWATTDEDVALLLRDIPSAD